MTRPSLTSSRLALKTSAFSLSSMGQAGAAGNPKEIRNPKSEEAAARPMPPEFREGGRRLEGRGKSEGRNAKRACLRRQRRHSYQPRATPWVYRPKTPLSAESAIHCAQGRRRVPAPPRVNINGVRLQPQRGCVTKPGVGPKGQPWVAAIEGPSTPTGLWPPGDPADWSSGHRAATPLGLMGVAARLPRVGATPTLGFAAQPRWGWSGQASS